MSRNTTNAAAPIECVQKGGDPEKTVVWACGKCKLAKTSKEDAIECCSPWVCDDCGKDAVTYRTLCDECAKKKQWAKDQAVYDKAQKVMLSEYAGDWLFCDRCDEYHPDVDSLFDAHDDDDDLPTWAWGTTEQGFTLDAERIISDQLEYQEFYEDAFDNLSNGAIKELQDFFDTWLKKQSLKSYMVDYSVVVDFEALAAQRKKERDE